MYRKYSKGSVEERLFMSIDRESSPDGCHLWLGVLRNGYGRFSIGGRRFQAHRVVWEYTRGPIPDGMFLCHNCPGGDNPRCVNPCHMFLGTPKDNVHDMYAKGRGPQWRDQARGITGKFQAGKANRTAVLDEATVMRMRRIYATGLVSYDELARMFKLNRQTAREATSGRTWRHLPLT